jgi:hypothetical protein
MGRQMSITPSAAALYSMDEKVDHDHRLNDASFKANDKGQVQFGCAPGAKLLDFGYIGVIEREGLTTHRTNCASCSTILP